MSDDYEKVRMRDLEAAAVLREVAEHPANVVPTPVMQAAARYAAALPRKCRLPQKSAGSGAPASKVGMAGERRQRASIAAGRAVM